MKTTVKFLDAVRKKHGFTSDYQLSKHLGCTRAAISSYRMQKSYLDEEMACKVAADLELDSGYVLACIASERAKKPEVKAAWKHTAELIYGLAAALVMVAVLPFVTLPYSDAGIIADPELCILCQTGLMLEWLVLSALCALLFALILVWSRPPISSVRYRYSRLSTASASAMVPGFHQARHHHDRIQ